MLARFQYMTHENTLEFQAWARIQLANLGPNLGHLAQIRVILT